MLLWPLPSFATASGRRNNVAFRFTTLTAERLVGRRLTIFTVLQHDDERQKSEIKKEWSPPTILRVSISRGEKYYFPFTSFSRFLLNFVYV